MVKRIILIVAIAMIAFSGVALAADTNTVTVTANIVGTCKFNSATSTLAFGALDQTLTTDATASNNSTTFWCTKNTNYAITDDDGLNELVANENRMQNLGTPGEFIKYSFGYGPATGAGGGKTSPITLTMNGTVNNIDYVNAAAGNYQDTVVLTIIP
jgi:spore coat protein U-like protein